MKNTSRSIDRVFSEICNVVYGRDAELYTLELQLDSEGRIPTGWTDAVLETAIPDSFRERYGTQRKTSDEVTTTFVNHFYFAVFDLAHAEGKRLRDIFVGSTDDGVFYHFNPIPTFMVEGTLRQRGSDGNLEWFVLAKTGSL